MTHRERDDQGDDGRQDETFEGRAFPGEAEWLTLPLPGPDELPIAKDFVDATLARLHEGNEAPLPADLLAAFGAPEPSPDFVDSTVAAVLAERRGRWRELLARYVAPDPSPRFVARTLSALQQETPHAQRSATPVTAGIDLPAGAVPQRPARRHRAVAWQLAAALAAAALLLVWLQRTPATPTEVRVAGDAEALAFAYAPTPLPAALASLARTADPDALPLAELDGPWLLLHGARPRGGR
jgi:hypothetical protein